MTNGQRLLWVAKWGTSPFWVPAFGIWYLVGFVIGRLKEYEGQQRSQGK